MNRVGVFAVAIGFVLLAASNPVWSAERQIARSSGGNLAAYMEEGACAEEIAITVRGADAAAFEGDKVELQQLLGGVQAIMGLQCPQAERFAVTGEVDGTAVYAGLIDRTAGGVLVDKEFAQAPAAPAADPAPSDTSMVAAPLSGAAPSQATEPPASEVAAQPAATSGGYAALWQEYGLHLARGLPVIAGARHSVLTDEQRAAASAFLDFVELALDPGLVESNPICWAGTYLPEGALDSYLVSGIEAMRLPGYRHVGGEILHWQGTNEFEKTRAKQAFLSDHAASLKQRAVPLPLEVLVIDEMRLPDYDPAAGGFDLGFDDINSHGATLSTLSSYRGVSRPRPSCADRDFAYAPPAATLPEMWAVDPARAEDILARINERKVYIAFTLRFREMPLVKMENKNRPSDRIPVWSEIASIAVYEDADLERPIETLPMLKAKEPILLSGVPEPARFPDKVTIDEESLALLMLRDHGDVLNAEAWRQLMLRQAESDKAYYERKQSRDTGSVAYSYETADYDQSHIPFFPNRFGANFQISFPEAMTARFKEWAMLRAENLPDELIFQAEISKQVGKPMALRLPVVGGRDTSAFVAAFTEQGYSANQILRPDVNPVGLNARFNHHYLAGTNVSRNPALILPNIATHYAPDFSDADAAQVFAGNAGSALAGIGIRTGKTEIVPIDDKSEAFVVHATPLHLTIYNHDASAVLLEHRYEVAALEAGRLDTGTAAIAPPGADALPLSAEAMDLLTVKHLADFVSDEDYRQMMRARWEYELSIPPDKGEPDWGRFFVPGRPEPTEEQQAELLPRFKEWAAERAAALPEKFRLYYDSFRVQANEPIPVFASGTYQLGDVDSNLARGQINSCKSNAHSHPALRPACNYLQNILDSTPAIYPFGLGYQLAGPRLRCRAAMGFGPREDYCEARKAQFEKVSGIEVEPGFREIFVHDKEIYFPGTSSEAVSLGTSSLGMMVDVAVVGARVADAPLPVPFEEALKRYAAFRESLGLDGSGQRRTGEAPPRRYLVFDAEVLAARLVNGKTQELISDLELRQARTPDLEALELPDTTAALDSPFGPDIIGLRLGMTFDEADEIIRSHMTVGRVLTRDRAKQPGAVTGDFEKYSSSRIYVAEDDSEFIILYDEPPSASEAVLGITRQMHFGQGQMTAAAALAQLRKKYGQEDWTGKHGAIGWGEGLRETTYQDTLTHQCLPSTGNQSLRDWAEEDGSQTQWRPASAHAIPQLQMYSDARGRTCGPVLSMQFDAMNSPSSADRLVLQLTDPHLYREHYEESERLVQSGEAVLGGRSGAPDMKL